MNWKTNGRFGLGRTALQPPKVELRKDPMLEREQKSIRQLLLGEDVEGAVARLKVSKESMRELQPMLLDADKHIRSRSIDVLGLYAEQDKECLGQATAVLVGMCAGQDMVARRLSLLLLERLSHAHPREIEEIVPILSQAVSDPEPFVRKMSIKILANLLQRGIDIAWTAKVVAPCFSDPSPEVRAESSNFRAALAHYLANLPDGELPSRAMIVDLVEFKASAKKTESQNETQEPKPAANNGASAQPPGQEGQFNTNRMATIKPAAGTVFPDDGENCLTDTAEDMQVIVRGLVELPVLGEKPAAQPEKKIWGKKPAGKPEDIFEE